MFDVRSMARYAYAECILGFSNVLDGTFGTLYLVDHIPGLAIGDGFYSEPLAGGHAAKRGACSYMGACLTVWLVALAIALVRFFFLAMHRSY